MILDKKNCYNCMYFSKRPGVRNYFIYKCSYWGIISQKVLPQSVIISSIGKRCPFFKKKINKKQFIKKDNKKIDDNNFNDDDLDIII